MEKTFSYGFRKRSARKDLKRRHCAHRFIAEPGRRKISLPQMYMILLKDYATPSFCSFDKSYTGTRVEINALMNSSDGIDNDYFDTVQDYFVGKGDAKAALFYYFPNMKQEVISHAELISRRRIIYEKLRFDHRNVWFCIYKIRAARAVVDLFYIRTDKGKFMRCVKAVLEQPEYLDDFFCHHEKWDDMTTSEPWGYPGMLQLDKQKKTICNSLGYIDKTFRFERQMYCDIKHPDKVDFQGFFDDYFGDG